ncbi:hypothetical protein [Chlamydia sp.]|uniref:hypothetical protein n=1 Tax=Chlamydia sp. TaxID=35827 RepID=UPI0025C32B9F|nr:hypothetical protein [Chlamydia sp.]MBQ8498488.1 hypothetical protein [Chlamydia sp.]
MKRLSILSGMLLFSSTLFGADAVYSENTLTAGVEFEEQEGERVPYSFYYPYQYEYYYPETGVDEETVENSVEENAECSCKKKVPEKKKRRSRRRT